MNLLQLTTVLAACLAFRANAFSFWFTSTPTQCAQMTVEWNGGSPPYTLLLVPTGHLNPETRTIIQRNIPSGNSVSFVLNFPAGSQFVAVLNDAGTGIGAGGTSLVTTVGGSSDSSCLPKTPSSPKFFLYLPSDVGECDSVDISWQSTAQDPVDILALIPGGQSFEIANVTNGADSVDWTANVRSGTDIMFVAGDKDGLGAGGSSDVTEVSDSGDGSCIDANSPGSTSSPFAGGVSTAAPQGGGGGGTGTSGGEPTGTNGGGGSPTDTSGGSNPSGTNNPTNPAGGSTGGASGTNGANDPSGTGTAGGPGSSGQPGSGSGGGGNSPGSGQSGVPGSGGGTVTGAPNGNVGSNSKHSNLGLIVGLVVGLLALGGLIAGGIFLYRRRQRRQAGPYQNLEPGMRNRHPWVAALTRGAHIRGGAGSSIDTLPSMYQTEPFIFPAGSSLSHHDTSLSHHETSLSHHSHPGYDYAAVPTPLSRPVVARASSSRSVQALIHAVPITAGVAGVHGARPSSGGSSPGARERKGSIGPHGRPPSRSSSGHNLPAQAPMGMPPPLVIESPVRVTRDSEDHSAEPEEMSPNPFNDEVVEIPPTYQSVRRASRTSQRRESMWRQGSGSGAWSPFGGEGGAQLGRSNASRHSRRSTRSTNENEGA